MKNFFLYLSQLSIQAAELLGLTSMNSPSNPGGVSSASGSELGSPGAGGSGHAGAITTVVGALDGAGGLVGLEPGEIGAEDTEAALAAQLGIRVLDDEDEVGRGLAEELARGVDDDEDDDSTTGRGGPGRSRNGAIMTTSAAGRISLAMSSNSPGVTVVSNLSAEVGVSLPALTSLAPSAMLASPSTDAASTHDDDVGLFDSIAEPPLVKEHEDSSRASNDVAGLMSDVKNCVDADSSALKPAVSLEASLAAGLPNTLGHVSKSQVLSQPLEQPSLKASTATPAASAASPASHQPCFECPFCKCSLASAQALNSHIETHIHRTSTSSASSSSIAAEDEEEAPRAKKAKVNPTCMV